MDRAWASRKYKSMRTISRGLIVICLTGVFRAYGASSLLHLTVSAGQDERNNTPVRVPISRSQIGEQRVNSVTLTRADGHSIPAQWTGPGLVSDAAGEL